MAKHVHWRIDVMDGLTIVYSKDVRRGSVSTVVAFATAPQTFTWTNHSVFTASAAATTTGDFYATAVNCSAVVSGASCAIQVVFKPSAVGPVSGTLIVSSNGSKLTSSLTGTGASALVLSTTNLAFGNTDVGFPATAQTLSIRNAAPGTVPLSTSIQAGDFAVASTCGALLASGASCSLSVTFKPTGTGLRAGQVSFNGQTATLSGNGVDFSADFTPQAGTVIAGLSMKAPVAILPIAGFASGVQMSCSTTAPASTCSVSSATLVPSSSAGASVQITTTSRYTVVGYGGPVGWKWAALSLLTGCLLWRRRRIARTYAAAIFVLAISTMYLAGCGSKNPSVNTVYTAPGAYTYTLTATDGMLVHTATYNLTVTAR